MTIRAFKDASDGYYQADVLDGENFPTWTHDMTPCAVLTAAQPDPQIEVDAKLAKVREVREAMLNRLAGIAFVAQLGGDTVTVDAFKTARLALLDITTGCPTDPELVDSFILGKYADIVALLPESLVKAFAGVDA